jgi:ubiquinone/menaquinone biosynthesis C-methylase UbiE
MRLSTILNWGEHTCPWWVGYSFDNRLRRLFQKPEKLLADYVKEGMTVLDIGCGMGFFSIGMAKLVGPQGRVISVDLQQKMLDIMLKRAERTGVASRISTVLCERNSLRVTDQVDFALAFWMAHEVRDKDRLFSEIRSILKPQAKLLVVEPRLHVSKSDFNKTVNIAQQADLKLTGGFRVGLSRTALFEPG